jgi:hypothetical protein
MAGGVLASTSADIASVVVLVGSENGRVGTATETVIASGIGTGIVIATGIATGIEAEIGIVADQPSSRSPKAAS